MNRRHFLTGTSMAASALALSGLDAYAMPAGTRPAAGYALKILATNWGFKGTTDEFCAAAKKEGYDGIEVWWPGDEKGQQELFTALKKHGLEIGFLCGGWQENFDEHQKSFKEITTAAATNKFQKPLYINCHSGRDYFPPAQNNQLIENTLALHKSSGVPVYHETHRSRMMFAAHTTKQFLEKYPDLKLTLDISHWCNVHESLLQDQKESVNKALERTGHIHARVGHQEGPQVNDPRAPEWDEAVKQHFTWWDAVAAQKKKNGELLTFLTEFGPTHYMPALPYTQQPVANQWEINVHMMNVLRKRYA